MAPRRGEARLRMHRRCPWPIPDSPAEEHGLCRKPGAYAGLVCDAGQGSCPWRLKIGRTTRARRTVVDVPLRRAISPS